MEAATFPASSGIITAGETPIEKPAASSSRMLSVAASSNVKSLAGSIAHTSRGINPPILQAVGATSLNQAVKAIAVARTFLEADDIDLEVEVLRIHDNVIRNLMQLKLSKKPRAALAGIKDDLIDLRCAATTETVALAGAIANNIRESSKVRVTAIGPNPVFRAVDAIVKARLFLQKDSISIAFVPMFTTIESSDERGSVVNAVQLVVYNTSKI